MNAIDTNVLVYALDDAEPAKQAKAQELIDRLVQPPVETLLPWQVAGELLSCLSKWKALVAGHQPQAGGLPAISRR